MTQEFKDRFNRKYKVYGGYDKLVDMLDQGVPYSVVAQHFSVDSNTVFRWKKRLDQRIDGIYQEAK